MLTSGRSAINDSRPTAGAPRVLTISRPSRVRARTRMSWTLRSRLSADRPCSIGQNVRLGVSDTSHVPGNAPSGESGTLKLNGPGVVSDIDARLPSTDLHHQLLRQQGGNPGELALDLDRHERPPGQREHRLAAHPPVVVHALDGDHLAPGARDLARARRGPPARTARASAWPSAPRENSSARARPRRRSSAARSGSRRIAPRARQMSAGSRGSKSNRRRRRRPPGCS